jgi:hypothetical protein
MAQRVAETEGARVASVVRCEDAYAQVKKQSWWT